MIRTSTKIFAGEAPLNLDALLKGDSVCPRSRKDGDSPPALIELRPIWLLTLRGRSRFRLSLIPK